MAGDPRSPAPGGSDQENPQADGRLRKSLDRRGRIEGAPEVFLHQRAKNHGQEHGGGFTLELGEKIAQDTEEGHQLDVELAVAEAEHAELQKTRMAG